MESGLCEGIHLKEKSLSSSEGEASRDLTVTCAGPQVTNAEACQLFQEVPANFKNLLHVAFLSLCRKRLAWFECL